MGYLNALFTLLDEAVQSNDISTLQKAVKKAVEQHYSRSSFTGDGDMVAFVSLGNVEELVLLKKESEVRLVAKKAVTEGMEGAQDKLNKELEELATWLVKKKCIDSKAKQDFLQGLSVGENSIRLYNKGSSNARKSVGKYLSSVSFFEKKKD